LELRRLPLQVLHFLKKTFRSLWKNVNHSIYYAYNFFPDVFYGTSLNAERRILGRKRALGCQLSAFSYKSSKIKWPVNTGQ